MSWKKTSLSQRFRHLIETKKISQSELAQGTEVDHAQISKWISGVVRGINRKNAIKISAYFECNVDWLMRGEGVPFPSNGRNTYDIIGQEKTEVTNEKEIPQVRMYRQLAQMDEDTLGEIQTWLNDMERLRPGFKSWFRLEFQNRFPEFDDWKGKITKNSKTGSGY